MGRGFTLLLHVGALALCALDMRDNGTRFDRPLNVWTVSAFVLVTLIVALRETRDGGVLPMRMRREHELLQEGAFGCVPSKGNLLRVRRGFCLSLSTFVLILMVATRLLPWPHFTAALLLLGCTLGAWGHLRHRGAYTLYFGVCVALAFIWAATALRRALRA